MTWTPDGALYPDFDPPDALNDVAGQVDFIARLCSAWDFGLLPDPETITEVRRPSWRSTIAACRLVTSPTYHLLRRWHHLPAVTFLGSIPAYITTDPSLEQV